jgi:protocatechuate 3,4-dioxygenase beta subunit
MLDKMFSLKPLAPAARLLAVGSLPCFAALLILTARAETANAQDNGGAWRIVITSENEPGEPMLVTGTVYAADGKTPMPGVEVYVYHTDNEGYYRKGANSSSNPRLKGTMITNAEGKYEYRSIKPAPYPGGRIPAHVHYVITAKGREKQYAELQFEGDRWLPNHGKLTEEQRKDTFAEVRPFVKDEQGVWRVVKDLTIK